MMGGEVKGGRVLGKHPESYDLDGRYNTGRGAWIPTTSNEAMWYGVAQWYGITDSLKLSYVLPNAGNFGCQIYSEKELYINGNGVLPGCGGDVVQLDQIFRVAEDRLLIPLEQVGFCRIVKQFMGEAEINVRCIILDQKLSASTEFENEFILDVKYNVTSDQKEVKDKIVSTLNTVTFQADASAILQMKVRIERAVTDTEAPSNSPTFTKGIPSKTPTPAPTEPTSSPSNIPTSFPTPKPTSQPVLEAFYGYEFVGTGECQDAHQFFVQTYDHLSFGNHSLPDDCPSVCAPFRYMIGFQGFEFGTLSCRCLFERGKDLERILAAHGGSATISVSSTSAQGPISRVVPNIDRVCYRMAEIEAPDTVENFAYVGYGHCLDNSNQRYERTIAISAANMPDCGVACSSLDYRGFWMQDTACHCLFDAKNGIGDGDDDSGRNGNDDQADNDDGDKNSNDDGIVDDGDGDTSLSSSESAKRSKRGKGARKRRKRRRRKKLLLGVISKTAKGSKPVKAGKTRRVASSGLIGGSGPIATSDFIEGHCYKIISPDELNKEEKQLRQGEKENQIRHRKRLRQHKSVPDLSKKLKLVT